MTTTEQTEPNRFTEPKAESSKLKANPRTVNC